MYNSIAEEIANEEANYHKGQHRIYMDLSYEKKPRHMKYWILSKSVQKNKLELPDWAYTHNIKPKIRKEDAGPNKDAKVMPNAKSKIMPKVSEARRRVF